jgi:ubiquitin carboxyl-terminal hydrolase 8
MNSILQVLSNTGHFNEVLIEGSFQKQVSIKNETQGRIVHEVAALIKALWAGQYKYIASKNLKVISTINIPIFCM